MNKHCKLKPSKKVFCAACFFLGLTFPLDSVLYAADPLPLVMGEPVVSQQKVVTGSVVDEFGAPVAGANVAVKGGTIGTITDAEGNYRLEVPQDAVLVISYLGYVTQEVPVKGQRSFKIVMKEDVESLDEVLVVGYGVQKRETATGSISAVAGEKLAIAPTANYSNALAGRLPGLTVVSRSGEPGSDDATFRIRGANTLGDNSPLIVVDGVPNRDMNRLNPNDIESVTVLKDASAAIYGSQAANGVILVTTKRGKSGKPQVNVSFNQGWGAPTVLPKTLDAATYLGIMNEINHYAGGGDLYTQDEINNYRTGADPWLYPNTDWYDVALKNYAAQHQINASVSGGSERYTYAVSIGNSYQDGIYKNSANKYSQMNFRGNIDAQLNDYIKLSFDIAGRQENRDWPIASSSSIFSVLRRSYPHFAAYWPSGEYGPDIADGLNPVVITTNASGYNRKKNYTVETKAAANIKLPWVKGLSFDVSYAFDKYILNQKKWETPYTLYSWDRTTYDENGVPVLTPGEKGPSGAQLTQNMNDESRTTINALANYERRIDDHNMKIMVGMERISGNYMTFEAFRKYFVSSAIDELFAGGDAEKNNNGSSKVNERLNYFGRVNYDYKSKYLAEFIWRVDGSYIFNTGKRYGFFPGISLGWRMSEEGFWKNNLSFIDYFKLRASWGQTGNDRIDPYQYLSTYGFGGTNYIFNLDEENKVLQEQRIPNPDVTWEVATQTNAGFDAQMLGSKLSFSAEYFYNWREDILWMRNASVPGSSGFSLPRENIGKVDNQGFEVQLGYSDKAGDFTYSVSTNFGYARNKIRDWDETPGIPSYQQSTGHPMPSDPNNNILYYKAIGVFHNQDEINNYPAWGDQYDGDKLVLDANGNKVTTARPGDVIFEDVNGDGKIDGLDRIRVYKTNIPRFTGGLNLDLGYKNLYATVFFQWATGAIVDTYYEMEGDVGNYLTSEMEGRWTESNPNADKPRAWKRYSEYWRNQKNTYWLKETDYLRLKNVEIGYNFPKKWLSNLYIQNMRVYVSGMNLLTFTGLKDFDPEVSSTSTYPSNRVYNVGINLTF